MLIWLACSFNSPDGRFLAFGSSDYTIGILDANTLGVRSLLAHLKIKAHSFQPLLTILKSHEFPPTTLRFNPTSSLLVSGSADNSVRVISVPAELGGQCEFLIFCVHPVFLEAELLFVCSLGDLVGDHIDFDRHSVGYRIPDVAVIGRGLQGCLFICSCVFLFDRYYFRNNELLVHWSVISMSRFKDTFDFTASLMHRQ